MYSSLIWHVIRQQNSMNEIHTVNKHTIPERALLRSVTDEQTCHCHSIYTVNHKKTCHFVFDYNSGVTCSIFIIFVLVERGRNTLQYKYLMAWWRHNSVTMHVTKVYFIQLNTLSLKTTLKLFPKKPENVKIFPLEDWQKNFLPKIGKYEHCTTFCESCE